MTEQYDSLNEKTKLVDVALKYTGGDIEKAKEMVSGQYLDNIVIKGKFHSEEKGQSGVFLAFFNYINEYIGNVTSLMSSQMTLYDKVRIFDDWKTLFKDIKAYRDGDDIIDSQNFSYFLIDSFIGYDVFPDVQERNLDDLTKTVNEIISKSFKTGDVSCQIELEPTSSLAMDLEGIKIDLPGSEGKDDSVTVHEDERVAKIEREARFIVEGKAVLSPVKGRNLTELNLGEKIKVDLPGGDLVSEKILKLLNSFDDEGNRLPVIGRLKAKIPLGKNGYILYAFVAKGVLAKIYEEENVKILMANPVDEMREESGNIDNRLLYLMGIIVGLIIISGIILLLIL